MILVIATGLLMTLASIVLRYQVAHQPIEKTQHIIVRPQARTSHQVSSRGREGTVPSGVFDLRDAESYSTVRRASRWEKTALGAVYCRPQQEAGEKCGLAQPAVHHDEKVVEPLEPNISAHDLSNEIVRSLVEELSSHPKFAAWLVTDDLMRRFVQSINLIAGGYSPHDDLAFLGTTQPFVVDQENDQLLITNGSFRRYDLVADVFSSINTKDVVEIYQQLAPQARETHREISWFAPEFDVRLTEAIDHLIETPITDSALEVERRAVSYAFADPSLEALTPAQKQLLRMGPRNARRIQNKLREIKAALGLQSLPPEQIATKQKPEENDRDITKPDTIKIAQSFEGMLPAP